MIEDRSVIFKNLMEYWKYSSDYYQTFTNNQILALNNT